MAEENNIEMKDLDRFKEVEREIAAEEETNIDDDRDDDELFERKKQNLRTGGERTQRIREPNVSIIVPQGLNPDIEAEQEVRELEQKKDFLREYLNISVDEADGTNSDKFLKNLELRVGKTNKIIGVRWKRKDVIVSVKDGYDYSDAKKVARAVDDFKAALARAEIEHGKTAVAEVEKQFEDATRQDVSSVLSEVEDQLRRLSFDKTQKMTPEEQIKYLTEAEIPHWKEKLEEAKKQDTDSVRTKQITGVVKMMELKADALRIKNNMKPETDSVRDLIKAESETGDISRFRRFSKWAKENLLGLSAVAISAAGIITTIVIAGRSAMKAGARGTKKFAKALAEVGKKVAPVLGAVLSVIGSVLSLTAKGLDWVLKNLWSLALLNVFLLINKINGRGRHTIVSNKTQRFR